MKLELRAITNNQQMRDKAVMMSSTTPSVKYSCSMSPLRFTNGSAAMEGMSGRVSAGAGGPSDLAGPGGRPFRFRGSRARGDAISRRFLDFADKTKSLASDGPNQTLLFAAVADCLA